MHVTIATPKCLDCRELRLWRRAKPGMEVADYRELARLVHPVPPGRRDPSVPLTQPELGEHNIMIRIPAAPQMPLEQFFALFGQGLAAPVEEFPEGIPTDRQCLLSLCRTFHPRRVLEIGIRFGSTAQLLLRECPWIEEYWGVDCLPQLYQMGIPTQHGEHPDCIGHEGHWDQRHAVWREGDTQCGRYAAHDSRFVLKLLPNGSHDIDPETCGKFDLIFIDGDHSYEGVWADTKLARRIVARPGVIAWHDYKRGDPNPGAGGAHDVIDFLNRRERNRIQHVQGTCLAFELCRPDDCHITDVTAFETLDVPDSPTEFNSSIVDAVPVAVPAVAVPAVAVPAVAVPSAVAVPQASSRKPQAFLSAMRRDYALPGSMGFAFLDAQFRAVSPTLSIWTNAEDPRIVRVPATDRYYVLHSRLQGDVPRVQVAVEIEATPEGGIREVRRATLRTVIGGKGIDPAALISGHGAAPQPIVARDHGIPLQTIEKNWVPFVYEGQLLISYGLNPHIVMEIADWESGVVRPLHRTYTPRLPVDMKLHGSTPHVYLPERDAYLSMFHTSWVRHRYDPRVIDAAGGCYSIGFMLIEARPPFRITHASRRCVTFADLYPREHFTTHRRHVTGTIFPAGLCVVDGDAIVSYGEGDERTRIVRCGLDRVLDTLDPIHPAMAEPDVLAMLPADAPGVPLPAVASLAHAALPGGTSGGSLPPPCDKLTAGEPALQEVRA